MRRFKRLLKKIIKKEPKFIINPKNEPPILEYFGIAFRVKKYQIKRLTYQKLPYIKKKVDLKWLDFPKDNEGLKIFPYKGKNYYHPVQMAEQVFLYLNLYNLKKDKKYLLEAEKYGQKIEKIAEKKDNRWLFPYKFDFLLHNIPGELMKAPWYSAMAQGQILSAYCRLYRETKKEKYLKTANKIFAGFFEFEEKSKKWITAIDNNNFLWLEEYPFTPHSHALNGFIFALFGLYDYWLLTNSKDAKILLLGALTTIERNIIRFRNQGDISYYCLKHQKMSAKYHKVHIWQLKKLYEITSEKYFFKVARDFWQDYH